MAKRLFVGFVLPGAIQTHVQATQTAIHSTLIRQGRVKLSHDAHITLQFVHSALPAQLVPELHNSLLTAIKQLNISPISVFPSHLGKFPTGQQDSVLWMGISGSLEEKEKLFVLQSGIQEACKQFMENPPRSRYRPHITVARCQFNAAKLQLEVFPRTENPMLAVTLDKVHLIESILSPSGPTYTSAQIYSLTNPN
eukprot:c239_g1_i1.p1 GENE.c239_g1_i1~~c239_g1_i1.p1  ORF type:complete len:196 (-),score=29.54 c239_g1_i1:41-628(-)